MPAGGSLQFSAMAAAFERARAVHEELRHDVCYRFAGRPVSVRLVGHGLSSQILPAFEHLEIESGGASALALAVDVWDEGETGVSCALRPDAGDWLRWPAAEGTLVASSDGRYIGFQYGGSFTLLDRVDNRILGCRKSAVRFSRYERSKPFVLLLSVWYSDRDVQVLHAGLVARSDRGVLMPGRGGAGKSTACLLCACDGFEFLGDDFVALEIAPDGAFLGHSIFNTACLEPQGLERFPGLARCFIGTEAAVEDKAILFLSKLFPGRVRSRVPISVVVLPRIVDRPGSRIVPAKRPEALREFAASTLRNVLPRPGAAAMDKIGRLVESVPTYWLELGSDTADVPRRVEAVLRTAGS